MHAPYTLCPDIRQSSVFVVTIVGRVSHGRCNIHTSTHLPQIAAQRAAERAAERKVSAESPRSTETNGSAGAAAAAAAQRKRITGPSQSSLAPAAKPEQAAGPAVPRNDGAAAAVEVAAQSQPAGGETTVKKAKTHSQQDTGSAPTMTR